MSPNVVITGASGLLGRAVLKLLKEKQWNCTGLAFSRCSGDLVKCDLTNCEEVTSTLTKLKPDFIVHAAAERFPDKVENQYEQTRNLNITATQTIAAVSKKIGAKMIYISTDYVFDGKMPPYTIESDTNPINKYGQTKAEGEQVLLETYPSGSCILRVPILYGPVEYIKESAVTCLLLNLESSEPISVSHYERRYPAHVKDIAIIIHGLISTMQKDASVTGIFQWSGLEMLTKYDMICAMGEALSIDFSHIKPETAPLPGTPRPYDCKMDNTRLTNLNISSHSSFKDVIREVLLPWLGKT